MVDTSPIIFDFGDPIVTLYVNQKVLYSFVVSTRMFVLIFYLITFVGKLFLFAFFITIKL